MSAILGVHGVHNYRPSLDVGHLSEKWTNWLRSAYASSAPSFDLTVAYYAPALRPGEVAQGADDPDSLSPFSQQLIRSWLSLQGAEDEVGQGVWTAPLRQALTWYAERKGLDHRLTRQFITVFFDELARYFDPATESKRAAAQDIVRTAIAARRPRAVVAHSLGSIVAYEVLSSMPQHGVELFLTLGSPLAMPDIVYPRLAPTPPGTGLAAAPDGITSWVNIADPGDLVAIPRRLSKGFKEVVDLDSSIATFDFHKVRNYLSAAATGAALLPYL